MSYEPFDIVMSVPDIEDAFEPISDIETGLNAVGELKAVLRTNAHRVYDEALKNVSGIEVQFHGTTFVVNRVTGKLAQGLEVAEGWQGQPLVAAVISNSEYSSEVEEGHGPIDMKPYLMGKTIAIRLDPASGYRTNRPPPPDAKRKSLVASTGKRVGSELVIFRKVGPHSTGWIIPAQPPRRFMEAAAETVAPEFERDIQTAMAKYVKRLNADAAGNDTPTQGLDQPGGDQ